MIPEFDAGFDYEAWDRGCDRFRTDNTETRSYNTDDFYAIDEAFTRLDGGQYGAETHTRA